MNQIQDIHDALLSRQWISQVAFEIYFKCSPAWLILYKYLIAFGVLWALNNPVEIILDAIAYNIIAQSVYYE